MQSQADIIAEVAKLNASQRAKLRRTVGEGKLEALTVSQRGWMTVVEVTMYGIAQTLVIGPRGRVVSQTF